MLSRNNIHILLIKPLADKALALCVNWRLYPNHVLQVRGETGDPGATSLTWATIPITLLKSTLQFQKQNILRTKYSRSCWKIYEICQFLSTYFHGKYQAPFVVLEFVRRFFSIPIYPPPPTIWPHFSLGNHGLIKL